MIAMVKGIALLHLTGVQTGLLIAPMALVLVAMIIMALVLLRDAVRRARCPHDEVRMVRQEQGYRRYFTEICMRCSKTSGVKLDSLP